MERFKRFFEKVIAWNVSHTAKPGSKGSKHPRQLHRKGLKLDFKDPRALTPCLELLHTLTKQAENKLRNNKEYSWRRTGLYPPILLNELPATPARPRRVISSQLCMQCAAGLQSCQIDRHGSRDQAEAANAPPRAVPYPTPGNIHLPV